MDWENWTSMMVKSLGKLMMVVHSLSGPKLFYRVRREDGQDYEVVLDDYRDIIVVVYEKGTKNPVFIHEKTQEGLDKMKTMNTAGIQFGVCYLPDLN